MQKSNHFLRRRDSNSTNTAASAEISPQKPTVEENAANILMMMRLKEISSNSSGSADAIDQYQNIVKDFVNSLLANNQIEKKNLKRIASEFIKFQDGKELAFLFETLTNAIKEENIANENSKWNLLKFCAALDKNNKFVAESAEIFWLEMFTRISFSPKMLRFIVPHFIENVMDTLPSSELFADFLFKTFAIGNYMAVLSLAGILKLMLNRDFEYPNFYRDVYKLIQPNVCYANYAQKFFDLLDLIMTSTHLPLYIIAAFVKKLGRILLFAPLSCQCPIMQLMKNILSRHPSIHSMLVNRMEPKTVEEDPYNEFEEDLQKCKATESSLWELKAIQCHWHPKTATKANFINSQVQDEENSLGWKSADEHFDEICKRSKEKLESISRQSKMGEYSGEFGEEEDGENDDEEEPASKKQRRSEKETFIREQLPENFHFFQL